jgi:CBS domain-containing protein
LKRNARYELTFAYFGFAQRCFLSFDYGQANKIGGLPVVDDGKLVGIVTSSDMLRAFLNVVEATQKILKP